MKATTKYIFILSTLLLSITPNKANAECVGCHLFLIINPAIYATLDLATAYVPEFFIEDDYEYSYWWTYGIGLTTASTFMLTADSLDDSFNRGLIGLAVGNAIGYYTSKQLKSDNLSFNFTLEPNSLGANFTYRF